MEVSSHPSLGLATPIRRFHTPAWDASVVEGCKHTSHLRMIDVGTSKEGCSAALYTAHHYRYYFRFHLLFITEITVSHQHDASLHVLKENGRTEERCDGCGWLFWVLLSSFASEP
jgi:hypothetical protein